jgi:3D (Asp-Asp-Asp) domain-containing protein
MKKLILILVALLIVKTYDIKNHTSFICKQKEDVVKPTTIVVTATMYMPTKGQCDNTPLVTACGKKINPKKASEQKWIAVSRDLLKVFKYGDKVMLSNAGEKSGVYTITDTMNKRFKNKIDILETVGTPLYKLTDVVLTKV